LLSGLRLVSLSSIHVYAMGAISKGSELAVKFSRFTGNYRLDKSAEERQLLRRSLECMSWLRKVAG